MKPGTEVFLLNARLRGFIGETNTALNRPNQPLIPYKMHFPEIDLPPKPITQNEDYSYFNFHTKNLRTEGATYVINVCNGWLSQGAGDKHIPCGLSFNLQPRN